MRTGLGFGQRVVFGIGIACGAAGCQEAAGSTYGGPSACLIEEPCADDPSETCTVPCKGSTPPTGNNTGSGGDGGSSSAGGGGSASVDAGGTVVELTSADFEETAPHTDPMTIHALDVDGQPVTAETTNGTFTLLGAASGTQWLLADDGGAVGGVFSTYSYHVVDGLTALAVPVVRVDVLEGIGTQIGEPALATGAAHLVLQIANEAGAALEGVEVVPVGQGVVGYDAGPGFYVVGGTGTGSLGLAVVINAQTAGTGTVDVQLSYGGVPSVASIPIAPSTVTYGRIAIDTTP